MAIKYLTGSEEAYAAYQPHTQVYYATHKTPDSINESTWLRKKYMDRSFISFSYGGRWIEDFNLIAVTTNDRLQRNLHADYEDSVSSYDVLDGQFYWGTHFTNNSLALTLATDGITQVQLEDFRRWFVPGTARELILAEHPNRAIMARLEASPALSVLPFEEKTVIVIDKEKYDTSTTIYKGEITINFIMDDPYWYSKSNIIGEANGKWLSVNEKETRIFEDSDALKIILEDGVPTTEMFQINAIMGENFYTDVDFSLVDKQNSGVIGHGAVGTNNTLYAEVNENEIPPSYGFVGPRTAENLSIANGQEIYLYYPGTAPSRPKISFTLTPQFENDYVFLPANSYTNPEKPYNIITLQYQDNEKQEFRFTTPSIYSAYNQVIKIFKNMTTEDSWIAIADLIKETVNHYYVRKWALAITSYFINLTSEEGFIAKPEQIRQAQIFMRHFLSDNNLNKGLSAKFSFNSKNGEAIGEIKCKVVESEIPAEGQWKETWGIVITIKENVGDMVRSDYLILKERNLPNANGNITVNETYKLTHDVTGGLSDVTITYQYMYY